MRNTTKLLWCGILILGLLPGAVAQDGGFNPKTFMLGEFVFTRPEPWVWVPVEDDKPMQKFSIVDTNAQELASILMLLYPAEKGTNAHHSGTIIPRWKEQFDPRTSFRTNRIASGQYFITFARVDGTQRSSATRKERRPDFALAGAVLETDKGTIAARVVGPREVIDRAEKDLKEMMQNLP